MATKQENLHYNPASSFAKCYGVWKSVTTESIRQPLLAQSQLQKALEYLRQFPDLIAPRRAEITRAYKRLQKHVDEVGEAWENYGILIGLTFRNFAVFPHRVSHPDTDGKTPITDELCDIALLMMDETRERALQAKKRNDELINKLATLCPGVGSPYQKGTGANRRGGRCV